MQKKLFASLVGLFAATSFIALSMSEPSRSVGQEAVPAEPVPAEIDSTEQLLEAVGTMGGVQLYQAYLNIGFVADGKGQELYAEDEARELLASVVGPLDRVAKQFNNVKRIAADEDDKKALDRLAKIAGLLKYQATSLQVYWDSGLDADADRFEKARRQTWNEINDFLRLDAAAPPSGPELAPVPQKISK